jgi:hypothetical protein
MIARRILSQSILALLLLSITPLIAQSPSTGWIWKQRFQTALDLDNNVFESSGHSERALSLRALYQGEARNKLKLYSFSSHWSLGYQAYNPSLDEDKWVGENSLQLSRQVWRIAGVGVSGYLRGKAFSNRPIRYLTWATCGYGWLSFPAAYQLQFGYRRHGLDNQNYTEINDRGTEIYGALQKTLLRQWDIEIEVNRNQLDYQRYTYVKTREVIINSNSKEFQKDQLQRFIFTLRHSGQLLWKMSYIIEDNQSNSYGFSYQSMALITHFSSRLAERYIIRLYAMMQQKFYRESLGPDVLNTPDSESQDSNFLVCDLSRNVTAQKSIFIRFGSYNNESAYRSHYYHKNTLTLGIEFRM